MIDIGGLYEIAIRVKDLAKAEPFYMDVLGLKSGLRDERRNWHFLWVGGARGPGRAAGGPRRVAHAALRVHGERGRTRAREGRAQRPRRRDHGTRDARLDAGALALLRRSRRPPAGALRLAQLLARLARE